ncbi:hypothetical protein BGZ63DRAFT_391841 [Mariannaea sp. PMI_226]|nr:hypothetical protein BGZ63DRAFT_391841 [Mariannaea sp. PMI_226]
MFARIRDARTALRRPLRLATAAPGRAASSSARDTLTECSNEVAERLDKIGLWPLQRGRKRSNRVEGDGNRLNIVSDGLCDDIMKYLGPSLRRHRGCDLLDINPGAGVWSSKLHEALQPRKHIMMEKDAGIYAPFLSDLTAKDNVELVPKSGIVWRDLKETLDEHFSHQHQTKKGKQPRRNDTLLVSINLAFYPPKTFRLFECVSLLVIYQLMSSIRTSSLFQKYGLVRMLVWINDDWKRKFLPRTVVRRKRSAFEAHLGCDWIHEVVGKDAEENRKDLRDQWINIESGYATLRRMEKAGLKPPPGRETALYKALAAKPSGARRKYAGVQRPLLMRPFREELVTMEAQFKADVKAGLVKRKDVPKRLSDLRYREKYDIDDNTAYLKLLKERSSILKMDPTSPKFASADKAWSDSVNVLKKNQHKEFVTVRDNYHLFRQTPPVLLWDQRQFEPLDVRPTEFYPNVPCSLLDFQPRVVHPLLRETGDDTSRAADISDVMLRLWFTHSTLPVSKAMDCIWPGFGEALQQCSTLIDPKKGGSTLSGEGELYTRAISPKQWEDIVEVFMNWPFRPTYEQLVARLMDDPDLDDSFDDAKAPALGLS